jgi:hypothetical protein
MKYELMLRARPSQESVATKHAEVSLRLQRIAGSWGCVGAVPPVKEPTTLPKSDVNLKGSLPKGMAGRLSYQNRKHLADEGRFDDYLCLEFNPDRVDVTELLETSFVLLASAFGAYRGHVGDLEFVQRDFDRAHALDSRNAVYRFHLANYFDSELVRRAFQKTVPELTSILEGAVHRVKPLDDGVMIAMRSAAVHLEEAEADNGLVWAALARHGIARPCSDRE